MDRHFRHIVAGLALAALPLVLMATLTAAVDPYNLFHRQPFATTRYFQTTKHTERQRLHAFGLIHTHIDAPDSRYDAILAGSSRTAGMSTELIAATLGIGQVADLSLIGSRGNENRILVERALETGRISTVVWEIDYWFIDPREQSTAIPEYLRTAHRVDDVRYLLTPFVCADAFDLVTGRNADRWADSLERLNDPTRLFTLARFQRASSAIASALRPAPRKRPTQPLRSAAPIERLDRDIIEVVERFPSVRFYLLFPVVPTLLYASEPPERIPAFLRGRRYLVERFRDAPNVRIFAFDTDATVAGNLANFSDANHCGHGADAYLLACMANGVNQLTLSSIDQYERSFIELVDDCAVVHDPDSAIGYDPAWRHDGSDSLAK